MDDTDRAMDDFRIELFIFPDGTSVEMMVFDRSEAPPVRPAAASSRPGSSAGDATPATPSRCAVDTALEPDLATATAEDARVCPVCGGDLVHPVSWQRTGEATWEIRVRCPECEMRRCVVMGRREVEQVNRELYQGAQALAREAERVSRRNFEDEARHFLAALRNGDIQPIDF